MKRQLFTISLLIASIFIITHLLGACRKPDVMKSLAPVQLEIPEGFPDPLYKFEDNPLSEEGIELGRKLFYDGRLSVDGQHPCSSCHQQIAAFGTYEHDRSHGVYHSHTLRNAPVLFNLAWQNSFHWDGEFSSLFDEAAQPITGHIEMGENFTNVVKKIQDDPDYRRRFREVFKTDFISPEHILKALAQFTGTLVSANSKYDRVKKGLEQFTTLEQDGYQVFQANCTSCHPEPMFTDYSFRNIGLPVDPFLNDFGKMFVSGDPADSLKFKVPTLRNVYISSNYMHDGRYNTLAQCINHYRNGVQQSATLDPMLSNGIQMTDTEAFNLALFLRTLTDSSFITNPKLAEPQ